MPEVRFKIDDSLYSKASELQQLGHFDTVGSAVRSLMGIFLEPSIEAIKRNQQAVANGAMFSPAVVPTAPPVPAAPVSPVALGGFGDSLSSLLKS